MTIGQRIAAWRRYRDMSQRDLADAVGLTQGAVAQWELDEDNEHKTDPSQTNLTKVYAALRITEERFYGRVPRAKAAS